MFCPGGVGAARSTSSYNGPVGALETDTVKIVICIYFYFTEI